jgi:hypothetical protein
MGTFPIFGFKAAFLEFRMVRDMPGLRHLIAQTYLGEVIREYQSTPYGSVNGDEKIGLGEGYLYPPFIIRR